MPLEKYQFPYDSDNYGLLLHCPESAQTACVDAGSADATEAALAKTGWQLSHIFITHHHGDHTADLAVLKDKYNAHVTGPIVDSAVSTLYDSRMGDGDRFDFAGYPVEVIATPGHTLDMLNFYFPTESLACTGDTLFVMGCGRIFEGDPEMMWSSMEKLLCLADDTVIYCSHEYTVANAAFAMSVDPDNAALAARQAEVIALRAKDQPTVPTRMDIEKATNPFLRVDDASIKAHLGMADASRAAVFAEIRKRKDNF